MVAAKLRPRNVPGHLLSEKTRKDKQQRGKGYDLTGLFFC